MTPGSRSLGHLGEPEVEGGAGRVAVDAELARRAEGGVPGTDGRVRERSAGREDGREAVLERGVRRPARGDGILRADSPLPNGAPTSRTSLTYLATLDVIPGSRLALVRTSSLRLAQL